ncbi:MULTISPECIES: permease-like cell division protein FtsX [unclassified Solwaraspora]|uniref:permease-like cell division protein FtsX n=1 Tax=unclassified Solwaraspora TaxID=2627926 RepID=UPI00248BB794|nr:MULTISPECIES: permease-like cell division protein FtsX [unclassified Solwaraspora]WBB95713.1 permease-like cell division protein FtsX [Solwaraspora sp. WMMA2059]WBC20383.1 permease-like cell division protein FtsX [Solwaraspora sp. WMMA2080]WJK37464.1 permease-like cell division protein FtsX [Solwaraspora sp. WMMA2065]
MTGPPRRPVFFCMEQLRTYFDRALDSEPAPPAPLDDLARVAMAGGSRLRRRRQIGYAATTTAAAVALVAVGVLLPVRDAPEPVPAQAAMPSASPGCELVRPTSADVATEAAVYLSVDVTAEQRRAVDAALRADPQVGSVAYESRQDAYQRFVRRYQDDPAVLLDHPDLMEKVTPDQLPESFRITLANPSAYQQVSGGLQAMPGVETVTGWFCLYGTDKQVGE